MDVAKLTLDGKDILKDSSSGILYLDVDRRKLRTDSDSQGYQGTHGRKRTPEYVRYRTITIQGVLDGLGNSNLETSRRYLEELLRIEGDTSSIIPRKLVVTDMFGDERAIDTIVSEAVEIIEYDTNFIGAGYKWTATLESVDSPLYKSNEATTITSDETERGGFAVPFEVDLSLDDPIEFIEILPGGNSSSDLVITITATDEIVGPIQIHNETTGQQFLLDIDGTTGDVIVVDGENKTATKNGSNVLSNRVEGSERLTAYGLTRIAIYDGNQKIGGNFDVSISFRSTLL